jgi:hypothetical protein
MTGSRPNGSLTAGADLFLPWAEKRFRPSHAGRNQLSTKNCSYQRIKL